MSVFISFVYNNELRHEKIAILSIDCCNNIAQVEKFKNQLPQFS